VYGKPGPFDWIVHGRRHAIVVEPEKASVNVSGDGPYKWISGTVAATVATTAAIPEVPIVPERPKTPVSKEPRSSFQFRHLYA
jgi:hypothetical protein